MSLTENIARRKYSALELLVSIKDLSEQGYDKRVIAQIGLSLDYIKGALFEKGEERLLAAVESGRVPLNVAITIAGAVTRKPCRPHCKKPTKAASYAAGN